MNWYIFVNYVNVYDESYIGHSSWDVISFMNLSENLKWVIL